MFRYGLDANANHFSYNIGMNTVSKIVVSLALFLVFPFPDSANAIEIVDFKPGIEIPTQQWKVPGHAKVRRHACQKRLQPGRDECFCLRCKMGQRQKIDQGV